MAALTSHINFIQLRNDNVNRIWKCVQIRYPSCSCSSFTEALCNRYFADI